MTLTKEEAFALATALDALGSYRTETGDVTGINAMGLFPKEEELRNRLHHESESKDES